MTADKPVIYIAGNHEFYTNEMIRTTRRLATKTKGTSTKFLQSASTQSGHVRFLGSMLWTDFDRSNEELVVHASKSMIDYSQMRYGQAGLNASQMPHTHLRSKKWLADEIKNPVDGKIVVITQRAPTVESWKEPDLAAFTHSYCNDLREIFDSSPITLWIHGHMHGVSDYQTNGVRELCNPHGCDGHQRIRSFDAAKPIEI